MPPLSARSRTPALKSAVTSPCTDLTSLPTRRAASRIETGPAPHSAFNNSHRFAVKTFQRSSGVSKLIRADFDALPVSQARMKSSPASFRLPTSSMTVFMLPPRYVVFEIGNELSWVKEFIVILLHAKMSMVALSGFVVVPNHALVVFNVSEAIFEPVFRGRKWPRQLPHNVFSKRPVGASDPPAHKQACLHVGNFANTQPPGQDAILRNTTLGVLLWLTMTPPARQMRTLVSSDRGGSRAVGVTAFELLAQWLGHTDGTRFV